MGTLILLSSSPPRPFPRSPTPAASSSPAFASPSSIFGNGHRQFKNSKIQRDSFQSVSGTIRSILGTKAGSENLPFGITKSQHTLEKAAKYIPAKSKGAAHTQGDSRELRQKHSNIFATAETLVEDLGKKQSAALAATKVSGENDIESIFITKIDVRPNDRALSPLSLDKAPSRRLDWTPPKGSIGSVEDLELKAGPRSSFPGDLLESFTYEGVSAKSLASSKNDEGVPTKRRRLNLVKNDTSKASEIAVAPKLVPVSKNMTTATTKRIKSPKKYTTITGLATSHYFGEEQRELEATPMLQYMATTQAQDIGNSGQPWVDTSKRKRAPRKPKAKKSLPISVLLSPESAMKAIDSQDTLFGSASQLARDESPTFIRDIVEATKQSESSSSCTPVPTQATVPSESGSATPRGIWGASRFIKSRNLWATASRDDDNALLQVDTIDLFDLPDLRLAFTGKDAMIEPTALRHRESALPEKALPEPGGGQLGYCGADKSNEWLDIDEIGIPTPSALIITKSFTQTRAMHTTSKPLGGRLESPLEDDKLRVKGAKGNLSTDENKVHVHAPPLVGADNSTGLHNIQMPVFDGFTTAELSKQIKGYGFKPFRKREMMIKVLQDCWKAKHKLNSISINGGATINVANEKVELATHGDILSDVHGLAARQTPKVPKAKVPKPKKDNPTAPTNPTRRKAVVKADQDAGKTSKQRKKAEPKTKKPRELIKEKLPRKLKAKASTLLAEHVIEISDIEDSAVTTSDKVAEPLASVTAGIGQATAIQSAACVATPFTTLTSPVSSPVDSVAPRPVEILPRDLPDINSQITDAITNYVASPSRDHQRDPTWHEKILMYDPIVLEDLAAWLNTKGLGLIGEDREVNALEVRAWCEMKGVCCYGVGGGWRGNVKDRARGANGGEVED